MQRRRKKIVKLNDIPALENLLQEVYVDACNQMSEASEIIGNLDTMAQPTDVDDLTKISKEKTNALKLKETASKMKLDISKLMNDIIKQSEISDSVDDKSSGVMFDNNDVFDAIRNSIEEELKNSITE